MFNLSLGLMLYILFIITPQYNIKPTTHLVYNDETSRLYNYLSVQNNIKKVIIISDYGGYLKDYDANLMLLNKNNIHLEILGRCMSACTIYMNYKNTCAYPKSKLFIHSAHSGGDYRITNYDIIRGNNYLWGKYTNKLKQDIIKRGGLTKYFKIYKADKYITTCKKRK